jgi:hypothetical protein
MVWESDASWTGASDVKQIVCLFTKSHYSNCSNYVLRKLTTEQLKKCGKILQIAPVPGYLGPIDRINCMKVIKHMQF